MSIDNMSLKGIREHVENDKGSLNIANPHLNRDLNDLKDLVDELYKTRNGDLKVYNCNCHGNELHNGFTQTTCASNTSQMYNKATISLKELLDYMDVAKVCQCVAVRVQQCQCNYNCRCNCDVCSCNCNY